MNIGTPPVLSGTPEQQLYTVRSYLFQMANQLNSALSTLSSATLEEVAAINATGSKTTETVSKFDALKATIIKNATYVDDSLTRVGNLFKKNYLAKSEFGTYTENLETAVFDSIAGLQYDLDFQGTIVTELDTYYNSTSGYIKVGIVEYDGSVPILGIAIGQDITKNVAGEIIKADKLLSTYTAGKLCFWDNGVEVLKLESGSITARNLIIIGGTIELGSMTSAERSVVKIRDVVDSEDTTKYGLETQWKTSESASVYKSNFFANEFNFEYNGISMANLRVLSGIAGSIGFRGAVVDGVPTKSSALGPFGLNLDDETLTTEHVAGITKTYIFSKVMQKSSEGSAWFQIIRFTPTEDWIAASFRVKGYSGVPNISGRGHFEIIVSASLIGSSGFDNCTHGWLVWATSGITPDYFRFQYNTVNNYVALYFNIPQYTTYHIQVESISDAVYYNYLSFSGTESAPRYNDIAITAL